MFSSRVMSSSPQLLLFVVLLFLLILMSPADGFNIKLFHNQKDSTLFSKDQVVVNCSEPICFGQFRDIYCQGHILWAAWHFGLQKECPGTRMRFDWRTVLHNFDRHFEQGKLHKDAFESFCDENFDTRPYLEEAHLSDWKPELKQLDSAIFDRKMRMFAKELHRIWPQLGRRFVEDVHQSPDHYPLLPVPNVFIIPGNLVQMYYYWDTLWIVRGLMISELFDTAKGILRNFAHVMDKYARGHIPNSGFYQHQRRSQPPTFTQMVADYYQSTGDKAFLEEIMPSVERELDWWRKNRTVQVLVGAEQYTAYRYKTKTNCPRPENLMLDYYYAMESGREDLQFIWSSINSASESGMDFSTRWFSMESDDDEMEYTLKGIRTNDIVPVDLNVNMAINYRIVARLYGQELGNMKKSKFYAVLAESLAQTVDALFRDPNTGVWFDFDLVNGRLRRRFFPVNIFPLLLFADQRQKCSGQWERDCNAAVDFMKASGALEFKGGIPSSMARGSIERWDYPNGEPRLVHLTVLALLKCAPVNPEAWAIAKKAADGLLTTAYNGLFHPRRGMPAQIWEKYDVRFDDGRSGFGGDYIPQTGFGSTNGALLDLIRIFYTNDTVTNTGEGKGKKAKA